MESTYSLVFGVLARHWLQSDYTYIGFVLGHFFFWHWLQSDYTYVGIVLGHWLSRIYGIIGPGSTETIFLGQTASLRSLFVSFLFIFFRQRPSSLARRPPSGLFCFKIRSLFPVLFFWHWFLLRLVASLWRPLGCEHAPLWCDIGLFWHWYRSLLTLI